MTGLILVAMLAQTPPPPPEPQVEEDLAEHAAKEGPGGQWGVVSLLAGGGAFQTGLSTPDPLIAPSLSTRMTGLSGVVGLGVRYGLRERNATDRMLMPAIAVVVGTAFQLTNFSPFLESRAELLSVSPGGPLQPNFVFYGTSGVTLIGLRRGSPISLAPHLGVGLGWNWLPRGGGGSWGSGWGNVGGGAGALVAIPIALAIIGMIFAGRIELRYTARPITGPGSDFFSVMVGVGT